MDASDGVVLASVVPTVAVLLWDIWKKGVSGGAIIFLWVLLLSGGVFLGGELLRAVIFGLIAGTIMQPLFADPMLTSKTLVYPLSAGSVRLRSTPIWVAALWGIALAQLKYLWLRFGALPVIGTLDINTQYWIFVGIAFSYFFVFEVLVGNFCSQWWYRKECRHLGGVAVYALIAEFLTVMVIPVVAVSEKLSEITTLVAGSSIAGALIALFFIISCLFAWRGGTNHNKA